MSQYRDIIQTINDIQYIVKHELEHKKARYDGDGDPGCSASCVKCKLEDLLNELQETV